MMKKTKNDVHKIIEDTRQINKELREGMANAKLTEADRQEIIEEIRGSYRFC